MSNESGRYAVPAARHRVEQSIERSRFICTAQRVESPEEAQLFVRSVSAEFEGATHNCWAYVAGPPASSAQIGMSDDGEPHGTAGRPMLTVLMHSGVGEIAAVVTRYYGGIKLGTGGLARAYSSSVQLVLETLPRAERVDWAEISIVISYSSISAVQLILPAHDGEILSEEYAGDVRILARVPLTQLTALRAALGDATRGQAVVVRTDDP
ncbi:MAG: YigZ family protein [Gemmatimonadaceae bacterium]